MTTYNALLDKFGTPVSTHGIEVKFRCPKCGWKALVADATSGVFYCFICKYGRKQRPVGDGGQDFISRKVNYSYHLDILEWLIQNTTLLETHREYLVKRGVYHPEKYLLRTIPDRVDISLIKVFGIEKLLESGWFKQSKGSSTGITAWPVLRYRRILIPIIFNGMLVAAKTRADPFDFEESIQYAIPTGSPISKYPWGYYPADGELLITEGELKSIAACEVGFNCWGSSGINGFDSLIATIPNSGYRRHIINDAEAEEEKVESRIVAARLATTIPNSSIVQLPKDSANEKMDLDLFIIRHGEKELEWLIESCWKHRETIIQNELKIKPIVRQ